MTLPHVKGQMFLGSANDVLSDPIDFLERNVRSHGNTFTFKLGPKKVYFFNAPKDIKKVLTENWDHYEKEKGLKLGLGESLLTSSGPTWLRQKKYTQSFFTRASLNKILTDISLTSTESLKNTLSGKPKVSLQKLSTQVVYDLVLKVLFGVDNFKKLEIVDAINIMTDYVLKRGSSKFPAPFWWPNKNNRTFKQQKNLFFNYIEELTQSSTTKSNDKNLNFYSDVLLKSALEQNEIHRQSLTFFLAGFETTVNALFWTIYLLLKHPEKSQLVKKEALKSQPSEKINDLYKTYPYIKACIEEAMRLYPPSWFRSRVVIKDVDINGVILPKGSLVWVSQYITHRDQNYWSSPEDFMPERFLNETKIVPFSYFPFSFGRHACIGREMAMTELVCIIRDLYQNYDISSSHIEEIKPTASITIRPENDLVLNTAQNKL